MNILLCFDFDKSILYIPDGYVHNLADLQNSFFDWLYTQPQNIIDAGGLLGFSYNAKDFLRYVNDSVLQDCGERAYFVADSPIKKIHGKLSF